MSKKVLLTGASGFLGSVVLRKLIRNGFFVVALSRSPIGITHPRLKWSRCDLASLNSLRKASRLFGGIKYVIHAAARTPQKGPKDNSGLVTNNINTTINLLKVLPSGIKQVVYCSSLDVYGEDNNVAISEHHLTQPVTPYGVTKLFGEHLFRVHFQKRMVAVASLRFSHLYGPREPRIKIIPRLIHCILNGGSIEIANRGRDSRDYLFIEDAAAAVIASLEKPLDGVFNVSSAKKTTIQTVIRTLEDIAGEKVKVRYLPVKEPSHLVFTNKKFCSAAGWRPETSFSKGLRMQYEYSKNSRD